MDPNLQGQPQYWLQAAREQSRDQIVIEDKTMDGAPSATEVLSAEKPVPTPTPAPAAGSADTKPIIRASLEPSPSATDQPGKNIADANNSRSGAAEYSDPKLMPVPPATILTGSVA